MTSAFRRHPTLLFISVLAIGLGVAGGFVAQALVKLIGFVTNLAFYGRLSATFVSPAGNHLGWLVILVPVIGGLIVGIMARYGSKAIRGHGIPEAMEQVLENNSRIPARITFLKPVSSAIAIGTGGPFGAEGPIIATGGALGSVLGQALSTTAAERKTLLAAGAAAGMAAIFGSPVSAVLLAVELLLFEFRARSLVPVSLAAATAAGMHIYFNGAAPVFPMPALAPVSMGALALYGLIGIATGLLAVGVTRAVYWIEDMFEHLPIPWVWWPALGGLVVGVVGYFAPRTLGVGYENITDIISNRLTLGAIAFLCGMKFISWAIALGSGTSGGTLAPLFTFGSGFGVLACALLQHWLPHAGLDVRMAGAVGMASIFAGASHALLASVVFAFETTQQPFALLPLLAGCTLAYLTARLCMQNSIMTEKIVRRGLRIPQDYEPDIFSRATVGQLMDRTPQTIPAAMTIAQLADAISRHDPEISLHQAWPILSDGKLTGIITRRDVFRALDGGNGGKVTVLEAGTSALVLAFEDEPLNEAIARMLNHGVGRLPVVSRADQRELIGYLSSASMLNASRRTWMEETKREPGWFASSGPAQKSV